MFRLTKTFRFEASHLLPNHDGKCARLHGHSWVGHVVVEGAELQITGAKAGMLVDYADLSAAVKPMVEDYLDHWHLNDSLGLADPTSEEIARWVFTHLLHNSKHVVSDAMVGVVIEETCTSKCEYYPTTDRVE